MPVPAACAARPSCSGTPRWRCSSWWRRTTTARLRCRCGTCATAYRHSRSLWATPRWVLGQGGEGGVLLFCGKRTQVWDHCNSVWPLQELLGHAELSAVSCGVGEEGDWLQQACQVCSWVLAEKALSVMLTSVHPPPARRVCSASPGHPTTPSAGKTRKLSQCWSLANVAPCASSNLHRVCWAWPGHHPMTPACSWELSRRANHCCAVCLLTLLLNPHPTFTGLVAHDPSLLLSAGKDARTICWDVSSAGGDIVCKYPASNPANWAWCPGVWLGMEAVCWGRCQGM